MSATLSPPPAGAPLADWLAYQERLHPRDIELGLARVRAVAAALNLAPPPPTLTIAGTNGKGSSAHLAADILRRSGYRVGLYTSPHLLQYAERVRIDGRAVDDAALCAVFARIEAARGNTPLTYFEFGTLAALLCFEAAAVEVQVLEVGLGGRLDAVNLVDADVALVTHIGLDHLDWLGPDREHVAIEKAGVFRQGRPAICADEDAPAAIAGQARRVGAPLQQWGRDVHAMLQGQSWTWQGPGARIERLPLPALPGPAYLRNAAGVIAALQALAPLRPVTRSAIAQSLRGWQVPGRFERRGHTVFDVAHNVEAAGVLAALLEQHCEAGTPVVAVLGMMADKPVEGFCATLAPIVRQACCIDLPGPRACTAIGLAARARAGGLAAQACRDVATAMETARRLAGRRGWVLVTGSFLTVAAGMAHG